MIKSRPSFLRDSPDVIYFAHTNPSFSPEWAKYYDDVKYCVLGRFEILNKLNIFEVMEVQYFQQFSFKQVWPHKFSHFFQTNDSRERERRGSFRKSVSVSKIFLNKKIKFSSSPFYPALVGIQKSSKQVNICLPDVFSG